MLRILKKLKLKWKKKRSKKQSLKFKSFIPKFFISPLTGKKEILISYLQADTLKIKMFFGSPDNLEAFINTIYSKANITIENKEEREKILKFVLQDFLEEFKQEWQILEAEANLIKRIK
jgi:hypothetical protein